MYTVQSGTYITNEAILMKHHAKSHDELTSDHGPTGGTNGGRGLRGRALVWYWVYVYVDCHRPLPAGLVVVVQSAGRVAIFIPTRAHPGDIRIIPKLIQNALNSSIQHRGRILEASRPPGASWPWTSFVSRELAIAQCPAPFWNRSFDILTVSSRRFRPCPCAVVVPRLPYNHRSGQR
jgi:hypothetical protein